MDKQIAALRGHVIVCGWGRVGRAAARSSTQRACRSSSSTWTPSGSRPSRVRISTSSATPRRRRPSSRRCRPRGRSSPPFPPIPPTCSSRCRADRFNRISSSWRGREESSVNKLLRAGADRVVNPQEIGGARIAAFVARPRVTEFLDVVMHSSRDGVAARGDQPRPRLGPAGCEPRSGEGPRPHRRLVLALHDPELGLVSVPAADIVMKAGQTLIAIGTPLHLKRLAGGRRQRTVARPGDLALRAVAAQSVNGRAVTSPLRHLFRRRGKRFAAAAAVAATACRRPVVLERRQCDGVVGRRLPVVPARQLAHPHGDGGDRVQPSGGLRRRMVGPGWPTLGTTARWSSPLQRRRSASGSASPASMSPGCSTLGG